MSHSSHSFLSNLSATFSVLGLSNLLATNSLLLGGSTVGSGGGYVLTAPGVHLAASDAMPVTESAEKQILVGMLFIIAALFAYTVSVIRSEEHMTRWQKILRRLGIRKRAA